MNRRAGELTANPFISTIIDMSDFGILALDARRRIIVWNPWLVERTTISEERVIGKRLSEVVTGIPETTLNALEQVAITGRPMILSPVLHDILIPFTKPSHQVGRIYPVLDDEGEMSGLVFFIHDVSPVIEYERFVEDEVAAERRRSEESLRRSEQLLSQTQRLARVGGWEYDVENNKTSWTDEVYRIYGVSPDTYDPGNIDQDIAFYEDRELIGKAFRKAVESGESYDLTLKFKNAGGEDLWLRTVGHAEIRDGKVTRVYGSFMDITDRKRSEGALKLSQERYSAFVKQSSEAICLFEIEHEPIDIRLSAEEQIDLLYAKAAIRECNRIFATSHGFDKPEDMIGFKIGQVFPRIAKENINYLKGFIQNGHNISDVETKELLKDGSVKYFLNSLIGQIENGKLERIWGAKQDIARIKKAEEEIRILNAELEQRVRTRTEQLEAANRELDAFAYSVSHDLRAPLRAINGFTEILIENFGSRFDAEERRICSVISDSAKGMGQLIDDLLAFSRLGRTEMKPSTIDMTTLARSVFFELTLENERERIDIIINPLPPVLGDPSLIKQVWMNLIGNAVKYSSKKDRAKIEVRADKRGEENVYSIRDNGVGFDMRYAGKLFGVFQRLHSKKEFEGTGVGLAIVDRILHRHGGRIWAEGEPGKGAVFHFTVGEEK